MPVESTLSLAGAQPSSLSLQKGLNCSLHLSNAACSADQRCWGRSFSTHSFGSLGKKLALLTQPTQLSTQAMSSVTMFMLASASFSQVAAQRGITEWCIPSRASCMHFDSKLEGGPGAFCPLHWSVRAFDPLPVVSSAVKATASVTAEDEDEDSHFGLEHCVLGIDIGGTSIKAAPVDTRTGELLAERHRICTPQPATPQAIAEVLKEMTEHFKWKGRIGVGLPCVVRSGQCLTAANLDKRWIGVQAEELFSAATGCEVAVINDADAAGYAEMGFGAGKGEQGAVLMCTFGTGIGTALFVEGILVPNLELGHIEIDGKEAEKEAAGVLVEKLSLSWEQWGERVNKYLVTMEALLWPNVIIVGGGVSEAADKWLHLVRLPANTELRVAQMRNDAGIVGAAFASQARAVHRFIAPVQVEQTKKI